MPWLLSVAGSDNNETSMFTHYRPVNNNASSSAACNSTQCVGFCGAGRPPSPSALSCSWLSVLLSKGWTPAGDTRGSRWWVEKTSTNNNDRKPGRNILGSACAHTDRGLGRPHTVCNTILSQILAIGWAIPASSQGNFVQFFFFCCCSVQFWLDQRTWN